jgi:hypothetical protein
MKGDQGMKCNRRLVLGMAAVFVSGQFLVGSAQAESLFKDILKATGSVYKFTGQAMDNVSQGREESLIGKGLKVGGKINKAVGSAMEEAGEGWQDNKTPEDK